jgi:hypothetical protein
VIENTGFLPNEARGKRVRVVLRNGRRPAEPWPADGKFGCNWSLSGHAFDIVQWEIAN